DRRVGHRRDPHRVTGVLDLTLVVPVDDTGTGVHELLPQRDQEIGGPDLRPETSDGHDGAPFWLAGAEQILESALVLGLHDLVGRHGFELGFGDLLDSAGLARGSAVTGALE